MRLCKLSSRTAVRLLTYWPQVSTVDKYPNGRGALSRNTSAPSNTSPAILEGPWTIPFLSSSVAPTVLVIFIGRISGRGAAQAVPSPLLRAGARIEYRVDNYTRLLATVRWRRFGDVTLLEVGKEELEVLKWGINLGMMRAATREHGCIYVQLKACRILGNVGYPWDCLYGG